MKFVDEFRDPVAARRLLQEIRRLVTQRWVLMEVCGGQTHSLLRYGIERELRESLELIHGPGCPVCVTSTDCIDAAMRLALTPGITLASFGDMLRVPGSQSSLQAARAMGASVEMVYSPVDALRYARQHPDQQVVFFAVGFETTIPASALAVRQAAELGVTNFSVLVSHVRVLPAMESLMSAPDQRVQGFLAAGHVCTVTGYAEYEPFARHFNVPVVVAGFEPVDLLRGLLECVRLLESRRVAVSNCYGRSVCRDGNQRAQEIVDSVFQVSDQAWRGFGVIPRGGYCLRPEYDDYDALRRFSGIPDGSEGTLLPISQPVLSDKAGSVDRCRAADVLSGRLRPCDCPEFLRGCTPDAPLGAPMVSSEGACAAWSRYAPVTQGSLSPRSGTQRSGLE